MQPQKGQNQPDPNKEIPSREVGRDEARKEREGSSFQPGKSNTDRINVGAPPGYEPQKTPSR